MRCCAKSASTCGTAGWLFATALRCSRRISNTSVSDTAVTVAVGGAPVSSDDLAEDGAAAEEAQRPRLALHLPRHLRLAGDDHVEGVGGLALAAHRLLRLHRAPRHAPHQVDEGIPVQLREQRQRRAAVRVRGAAGVRRGQHLDGAVGQLLALQPHQVRLHLAVVEGLRRQRRGHRGAARRVAHRARVHAKQRLLQAPLVGAPGPAPACTRPWRTTGSRAAAGPPRRRGRR